MRRRLLPVTPLVLLLSLLLAGQSLAVSFVNDPFTGPTIMSKLGNTSGGGGGNSVCTQSSTAATGTVTANVWSDFFTNYSHFYCTVRSKFAFNVGILGQFRTYPALVGLRIDDNQFSHVRLACSTGLLNGSSNASAHLKYNVIRNDGRSFGTYDLGGMQVVCSFNQTKYFDYDPIGSPGNCRVIQLPYGYSYTVNLITTVNTEVHGWNGAQVFLTEAGLNLAYEVGYPETPYGIPTYC